VSGFCHPHRFIIIELKDSCNQVKLPQGGEFICISLTFIHSYATELLLETINGRKNRTTKLGCSILFFNALNFKSVSNDNKNFRCHNEYRI
jgi:hypothetical protein